MAQRAQHLFARLKINLLHYIKNIAAPTIKAILTFFG